MTKYSLFLSVFAKNFITWILEMWVLVGLRIWKNGVFGPFELHFGEVVGCLRGKKVAKQATPRVAKPQMTIAGKVNESMYIFPI